MRAAVVDLLACPHCRRPLRERDRVVLCDAGHTFDVARQGYVNLRRGGPSVGMGDTADMVAARVTFLEAGHYARISAHVASAVSAAAPDADGRAGAVVDVGSGPGHHLATVLEAVPDRSGLGLDLSPYAARRAARCHPRAGAVVCDVWGDLPVRDGVAAAALSIFAPRNADETARVLTDGGVLVVVTPEPAHLGELVTALDMVRVDPRKRDRLGGQLAGAFVAEADEPLRYTIALSRAEAAAVARMGPSAWHLDPAVLHDRVDALAEPVEVTVAVRLSIHRRREGGRRR